MVLGKLPVPGHPTFWTIVGQDYKMDLDVCDCFGRNKLCLITKEIQYG